jgi:hypothetical protein
MNFVMFASEGCFLSSSQYIILQISFDCKNQNRIRQNVKYICWSSRILQQVVAGDCISATDIRCVSAVMVMKVLRCPTPKHEVSHYWASVIATGLHTSLLHRKEWREREE